MKIWEQILYQEIFTALCSESEVIQYNISISLNPILVSNFVAPA